MNIRIRNGYQQVCIDDKWVYLHHYIWQCNHGTRRKGYHIHHIDGNKFNNSIENLVELKSEYHILMHELAVKKSISIKDFYVFIGMLPVDNMNFYSKLTEISLSTGIKLKKNQTKPSKRKFNKNKKRRANKRTRK